MNEGQTEVAGKSSEHGWRRGIDAEGFLGFALGFVNRGIGSRIHNH
jgi:hypothetical protein